LNSVSSFLNRKDFIGILLPGYVAILTYLLMFRPDLLLTERTMPFDIFSSVVFFVAGPALGLTILQLQQGIWTTYGRIRRHKEEFPKRYAIARLEMTENERLELDKTEALMDFTFSTAISMLALFSLGALYYHLIFWTLLTLLGAGIVLLFGGYNEWSDTYSPMITELVEKFPLERGE
jgi:hypothetical protein